MEKVIQDILEGMRTRAGFDERDVTRILQLHNRRAHGAERAFVKKDILPFLFEQKEADSPLWRSWNIDEATEERLIALLRVKPRRTSSGVATVSVITKPWPCSGECLFCPNDVRMPKSYLANEPACQRAERNYFDPYLQVASRLQTLHRMGHPTDKVELIILGGTWTDYEESYRLWFVGELFRAVNEFGTAAGREKVEERKKRYEVCGISNDRPTLEEQTREAQSAVDAGKLAYNEAIRELYLQSPAWEAARHWQRLEGGAEALEKRQRENEGTAHRVVGLVVETRPDAITPEALVDLRRLGCTKVQMGIQSLNERRLAVNSRHTSLAQIKQAFALLRLFGFKIHIHMMANLFGATPDEDIEDYRTLVSDPAYLPDEVKLYPCVLVESSDLTASYEQGAWCAYPHEELVHVLAADLAATPPYVRISRMIRDISTQDIIAGNTMTNLRQVVERLLQDEDVSIAEMRHREVNRRAIDDCDLALQDVSYETAVSTEHFLQWVTSEGVLAACLRLSLPARDAFRAYGMSACGLSACGLPDGDDAMIREVHVYSEAARLHKRGESVQHRGLGRSLIERACEISRAAGYGAINVISAVGTRAYYRSCGFEDAGLYQKRSLAI